MGVYRRTGRRDSRVSRASPRASRWRPPLKTMCSRKCDSPFSAADSCRAPARSQTPRCAEQANSIGCTATVPPCGSVPRITVGSGMVHRVAQPVGKPSRRGGAAWPRRPPRTLRRLLFVAPTARAGRPYHRSEAAGHHRRRRCCARCPARDPARHSARRRGARCPAQDPARHRTPGRRAPGRRAPGHRCRHRTRHRAPGRRARRHARRRVRHRRHHRGRRDSRRGRRPGRPVARLRGRAVAAAVAARPPRSPPRGRGLRSPPRVPPRFFAAHTEVDDDRECLGPLEVDTALIVDLRHADLQPSPMLTTPSTRPMRSAASLEMCTSHPGPG